MDLHTLPKTTDTKKKRLGRGYGSGVGGHTSSRGSKGQKARSKVASWFEGGQLPMTKRLPFLRGKDRFKSLSANVVVINLAQLSNFKANSKIDKNFLVKEGLLTEKEAVTSQIKVLGTGSIDKAITLIGLKASQSAKEKIEQAGGSLQDK